MPVTVPVASVLAHNLYLAVRRRLPVLRHPPPLVQFNCMAEVPAFHFQASPAGLPADQRGPRRSACVLPSATMCCPKPRACKHLPAYLHAWPGLAGDESLLSYVAVLLPAAAQLPHATHTHSCTPRAPPPLDGRFLSRCPDASACPFRSHHHVRCFGTQPGQQPYPDTTLPSATPRPEQPQSRRLPTRPAPTPPGSMRAQDRIGLALSPSTVLHLAMGALALRLLAYAALPLLPGSPWVRRPPPVVRCGC